MSLHPPMVPSLSTAPTPAPATSGPPADGPPAPLPPLEAPAARPPRRRWPLLLTALFALPALGAAGWSALSSIEDPSRSGALDIQPAERGKVTFTIVEKGELAAARNTKLIC